MMAAPIQDPEWSVPGRNQGRIDDRKEKEERGSEKSSERCHSGK
jgi:hypothetical protein